MRAGQPQERLRLRLLDGVRRPGRLRPLRQPSRRTSPSSKGPVDPGGRGIPRDRLRAALSGAVLSWGSDLGRLRHGAVDPLSRRQSRLQDAFDSRRIADRLEAVTTRTAFTVATPPSSRGHPSSSSPPPTPRAGPTSSTRADRRGSSASPARRELAFPDYDGNGMFKSLGNVTVNPNVGLLFIDFERPRRLRVNGTATVSRDDPLMEDDGRRADDRAGRGAGDLPELPALHPDDEAGRAVDLCAEARRSAGRAGVEIRRRNSPTRCIRDRRWRGANSEWRTGRRLFAIPYSLFAPRPATPVH